MVDAAVIQELSMRRKNGCLRGNVCSRNLHQLVGWIEYNRKSIAILFQMLPDLVYRLAWIKLDHPECDFLRGETAIEILDHRGVTIRDWAVSPGEDQHRRLGIRSLQGLYGMPLQIE